MVASPIFDEVLFAGGILIRRTVRLYRRHTEKREQCHVLMSSAGGCEVSWSLSKFPCRRWRSAVSSGWIDFAREPARFVLVDVRARRRKVFAPSEQVILGLQFGGCSLALDTPDTSAREPEPRREPKPGSLFN